MFRIFFLFLISLINSNSTKLHFDFIIYLLLVYLTLFIILLNLFVNLECYKEYIFYVSYIVLRIYVGSFIRKLLIKDLIHIIYMLYSFYSSFKDLSFSNSIILLMLLVLICYLYIVIIIFSFIYLINFSVSFLLIYLVLFYHRSFFI
jgi:hypothetical protein